MFNFPLPSSVDCLLRQLIIQAARQRQCTSFYVYEYTTRVGCTYVLNEIGPTEEIQSFLETTSSGGQKPPGTDASFLSELLPCGPHKQQHNHHHHHLNETSSIRTGSCSRMLCPSVCTSCQLGPLELLRQALICKALKIFRSRSALGAAPSIGDQLQTLAY